MPQETHVLCCYSCKMFQAHIVKKTNKWQCKICNEKQSIQRVYFQGSGSDCRINVQMLNASKESQPPIELTSFKAIPNVSTSVSEDNCHPLSRAGVSQSKWVQYLHTSEPTISLTNVPTETVVMSHVQDNNVVAVANGSDNNPDQSRKKNDKSIFESNENFDTFVDF